MQMLSFHAVESLANNETDDLRRTRPEKVYSPDFAIRTFKITLIIYHVVYLFVIYMVLPAMEIHYRLAHVYVRKPVGFLLFEIQICVRV